MVLVGYVEIVKHPESRAFSTLIRFRSVNRIYRTLRHALYSSGSLGFVLCGTIPDWIRGLLGRGRTVDVNELVRKVVKGASEVVDNVSGDEAELRRLVLILLDNAVKYSRSGGEIRLRLEAVPDGGRKRAVVVVRDNGIGISAADLPHVFERFYRASKDRSRKVAGVGLGLSIAQSIVQRHNGAIQVESVLGTGSTFRIVLPAL